jgi:hypothetical protein
MGDIATYLANELLDHVLGEAGETWTAPSNRFLCLCKSAPSASALNEPSGGSYARVACDDWNTASARATSNSATLSYAQATADWGVITHFAIVDASTIGSGNHLAYGELTAAKTVTSGTTVSVVPGDLDISLDAGGVSTYLANAMLDLALSGTTLTQPTSLYLALATTAPTDTDDGSSITEPSGGGYARLEHNDFSAASGGSVSNGSTASFAAATANWGTCGWIAVCDHATTGNVLYHKALDNAAVIESGDTARFIGGALTITME